MINWMSFSSTSVLASRSPLMISRQAMSNSRACAWSRTVIFSDIWEGSDGTGLDMRGHLFVLLLILDHSGSARHIARPPKHCKPPLGRSESVLDKKLRLSGLSGGLPTESAAQFCATIA